MLQGKWTLQIVHALMDGPRGFNELARLIGGCNPSTLAQRLETLIQRDLLTRRVEATAPPRTLYELTPAGAALAPVLAAMDQWARRYLRRARPAPARRSSRAS